MLFVLAIIALVLLIFYFYWNSTYDYWKKLNVVYHPPTTFFGNIKESIFMTKSLGQIYTEIYNAHKDAAYVGVYQMRQPCLLIRDPDIIKDILIKDFHNFEKNGIVVDETADPIASKNPFFQYGQRWKVTRSQLSNCFSSGKIKLMFPLISEVSKNLSKYLKNQGKVSNPINAKELAGKFTTDAVATSAFGLEAKSFEDPNAEFIKMGKKTLAPTLWFNIKMLLIIIFPSLSKIFKIRFIQKDVADYFRRIISETLQYRKEHNLIRNDFLDIIAQLKFNPGEFGFGDDDITSHAVSFFGDGFETSSISLSFALYEIARHATIQQKLRDEIEQTLKKYDGILTYEAIQEMNYLDCIFSESMRLRVPVLFLTKTCTGNYTLPPCTKGRSELLIGKDMHIILPVYALHYDPKYFPDPKKFDPERFSENNKHNIHKGAYLPFGNGPRVCIGMRFAALQIKAAIIAIIRDFDIRVNNKTKEPLEIDPKYFMLLAKGGIWLDFYKRNV